MSALIVVYVGGFWSEMFNHRIYIMGCSYPIWYRHVVLVLLLRVNGSSTLGHLKGFDFQKEHDGSIIGIEEVIQQSTFPGRLSIVLFFWNTYLFNLGQGNILSVWSYFYFSYSDVLWWNSKPRWERHRLWWSLFSRW